MTTNTTIKEIANKYIDEAMKIRKITYYGIPRYNCILDEDEDSHDKEYLSDLLHSMIEEHTFLTILASRVGGEALDLLNSHSPTLYSYAYNVCYKEFEDVCKNDVWELLRELLEHIRDNGSDIGVGLDIFVDKYYDYIT